MGQFTPGFYNERMRKHLDTLRRNVNAVLYEAIRDDLIGLRQECINEGIKRVSRANAEQQAIWRKQGAQDEQDRLAKVLFGRGLETED